ncbi:MAG: Ig-like domain-containing protein [Haliea sp.]|nr:Ig-like domain-containing protein [Haliea sp.]
MRFDEPLNPILTAGVQLQDEGGTAVTADISFSSDRRTVTVVPRSLLAPNSSYLLSVSGVQDISGNPLLVPVAMTFTTGDGLDNVQGGIVNWSYAQGAVLPLNAVLEIALSERIDPTLVNTDPATGRRVLRCTAIRRGRFMRGSGTVSADGQRLRFVRTRRCRRVIRTRCT